MTNFAIGFLVCFIGFFSVFARIEIFLYRVEGDKFDSLEKNRFLRESIFLSGVMFLMGMIALAAEYERVTGSYFYAHCTWITVVVSFGLEKYMEKYFRCR